MSTTTGPGRPVVATWKAILAQSRLFPRVPRLRGAVRLLDEGASFVLEGGRQWREGPALLEAVPEPTALGVLAAGGALLAGRRRARNVAR